MQVICRTRGQGKTTDLLQLALDEGYIFVAHNVQEVERLQRICADANLREPEFWTYDKLTTGQWAGRRQLKGIVIDNVDMLLQQLAGPVEIRAVAISQEMPDAENN